MSLIMPKPDEKTLSKSDSIISSLRKISKNVLSEEEEKAVYETDGLSIHRQRPIAVVLPETTEEVSKVLKATRVRGKVPSESVALDCLVRHFH